MTDAYTPTVLVEIAFGYTPISTSIPTSGWVDVSAYAGDYGYTRGRGSELETFSASTITIELDSPARRFDPLYASGPYYGQLKPNTPIRVRALHLGVYYPRWYGYIDKLRYRPSDGDRSVCEVTATDGFRVLADMRLPASVYEATVLADAPRGYWKLSDGGERIADSSGNRFDGSYEGGTPAAAIRPYSPDGSSFSTDPNVRIGRIRDARSVIDDNDPMTIEFWCQYAGNGVPLQEDHWLLQGSTNPFPTSSSTQWFEIIAYPGPTYSAVGGEIYVRFGDGIYQVNFYANLFDGLPHHVVVVRAGDAIVCFVDGIIRPIFTLGNVGTASLSGDNALQIGRSSGFTGRVVDDNYCQFRVSDVAIYTNTNMVEATVLAHYADAVAPWDRESPRTRIGRVLDLVGWPAGLRDLENGEVVLGPASPDRAAALDYLQRVGQTEGGRLFMSADGKVTFHGAASTLSAASSYTFTDAGTGVGIVDSEIAFSLDDTFLYDAATVEADGGAPQTVLASGVTDPLRVRTLSGLLMRDETYARHLAERLVWRYSTPATRVDGWTVQPELDVASWPTILGLEIGDVVTVQLTPDDTGSAITVALFVEQITETVTDSDWTITFYGSPIDSTVYLEWGGPNGSGWGEGAWR